MFTFHYKYLLVIGGVVLVLVGYLYFSRPAPTLPVTVTSDDILRAKFYLYNPYTETSTEITLDRFFNGILFDFATICSNQPSLCVRQP